MFCYLKAFFVGDSGAVSVDWVILTAGALALALGATAMVIDGTETASGTLAATLSDRPVGN